MLSITNIYWLVPKYDVDNMGKYPTAIENSKLDMFQIVVVF